MLDGLNFQKLEYLNHKERINFETAKDYFVKNIQTIHILHFEMTLLHLVIFEVTSDKEIYFPEKVLIGALVQITGKCTPEIQLQPGYSFGLYKECSLV